MNTTINLTYKGEKYTLEYNRMAIKLLEQNGFELDEFLKKPMSNIELAFTGAFYKNHNKTTQNTIDERFKQCKDKAQLIATLQKMIQETYESLLEEPSDSDEGNVSWEVVDLSPKTNKQ